MATLGMGRSYDLTYDQINGNIEDNRIGNYAYGYINDNGLFVVRYVGRSDSDLKERVRHGIAEMEADKALRFERFKFSYADSVVEAYYKECLNYHDFGGAEGRLINKAHPAKPEGHEGKCPICGE